MACTHADRGLRFHQRKDDAVFLISLASVYCRYFDSFLILQPGGYELHLLVGRRNHSNLVFPDTSSDEFGYKLSENGEPSSSQNE